MKKLFDSDKKETDSHGKDRIVANSYRPLPSNIIHIPAGIAWSDIRSD